jgi:cysteinyl-tRNA synthetase
MSIKFYNTLSRQKEEFKPINDGQVRMYTCGPTVYNYAHIGNYRAYIFEDLLRRYLKLKGFKVEQVMNLTDVDDKIIRDSIKEGIDFKEFTKPYKKAFFDDLDTLRIERAEHYPEATEHIQDMVDLVKKLLDNNLAYRAQDGSIYYKVEAFPEYGQLANLNKEEMQKGSRMHDDEYGDKETLRDFALWKAYKPEEKDIYWETDLGKGRPGWHIECSAMSTKYLGNHFDIHTGGVDNIFPHHENEIAQSQGATGEKFVNYWLHCEHLIVENQKMSKSLGNFYTLRDLLDKGFDPLAIRYTLLTSHYRRKLNFTFDKVKDSRKNIIKLRDFYNSLDDSIASENSDLTDLVADTDDQFMHSLDDDLNISGALGSLFTLVREVNNYREDNQLKKKDAEKIKEFVEKTDQILDVLEPAEEEKDELSEEEKQMIKEREKARENKNWDKADKIRDKLQERGIIIQDGPEGTTWKRI